MLSMQHSSKQQLNNIYIFLHFWWFPRGNHVNRYPGGGGGHFHTWEYWGCAAGQGAFLSFQLWHRVSFFELPELGQDAFLSFQLWAPA